MSHGRHTTIRKPTDQCYSAQWSGVSYAPHCPSGCKCAACGENLHLEGHDAHYCPHCDDFRAPKQDCKHR